MNTQGKNFPRSKKSLLQQKTKMFHFMCSLTHVLSFFGLLFCHFVLGRVFSTVDAWHYRYMWFALSASIVNARHCICRWFTLSANIVKTWHWRHRVVNTTRWFTLSANIINTWHWRHRVVNTTNLHYNGQHPWTPQPSDQIHSLICWWIVKEVHLLLYQLVLF